MKNDRIWIGTFICILICGIAGTVCIYTKMHNTAGNTVVITKEGKELYRLNLFDYTQPYEINIKDDNGTNRVLIENGRIRMEYADCPDKTCVKTGWLDRNAVPIVCLPHKVVIRYVNDSDLPDGMTGVQRE